MSISIYIIVCLDKNHSNIISFQFGPLKISVSYRNIKKHPPGLQIQNSDP